MKLSDEDRIRMLAEINREGNVQFFEERRARYEKRKEKEFIKKLEASLGFNPK